MARLAVLSALCAVAMLLLMGCASEPKPKEGVQGIVVQNAEGLLGQVQPAGNNATAQQPQDISCTLDVPAASALVGEQVSVVLKSSFQGSAQFDLACGNETRHLLSENTLVYETSCKFGTPGAQKVTAAANGKECASKTVQVLGKANGTCSIDAASVERDLQAHYYKWTVRFDGFSPGDEIVWVCDSTVSRMKLAGDPIWGMPRMETLSCNFPSTPKNDAITVSVGGVACGQVSTR